MGRMVIACYRPKPGCAGALDALTKTHFARLYREGLVTHRLPWVMRAADGTVLEVFEWKSQAAIDSAHTNPAVQVMWGQYAAVCDYIPVASIPEAAQLFSGFEPAELLVEEPAFFQAVNHVQVSARISTSGAIREGTIEEMAREGYAALVNLLPDDSKYALANEADLVRNKGIAYHHVPVDFDAPKAENYKQFERIMDGIPDTDRVYVHCAANMRVSVFMAIYGRKRMGWSRQRAMEHIGQVWQPNEIWQRFLSDLLER